MNTDQQEIADLRRRAEQAEALALTLHAQRDQAESSVKALREALVLDQDRLRIAWADAAVLRQALIRWIDADGTVDFADADESLAELARSLRGSADHPSAAMLAELKAARAVVEAARKCVAVLPSNPEMRERLVVLSSALNRYRAAVKAREG